MHSGYNKEVNQDYGSVYHVTTGSGEKQYRQGEHDDADIQSRQRQEDDP
jgi:hypothetical protein